MTKNLICILDEDKEKCTECSSCDLCKFSYIKTANKKKSWKKQQDEDFYLDDEDYFAI